MRDSIHLGEALREGLDVLDMSAAELVPQLDVPIYRIAEVLDKSRSASDEKALRLGQFL